MRNTPPPRPTVAQKVAAAHAAPSAPLRYLLGLLLIGAALWQFLTQPGERWLFGGVGVIGLLLLPGIPSVIAASVTTVAPAIGSAIGTVRRGKSKDGAA